MAILNKQMLYSSQLYDKYSIILPTATARHPSPNEAHIMNVELYLMVNLYPNYSGIMSKRGNRTELHNPYSIDITISPNSVFTLNIRKYDMKVVKIPTKANMITFVVGFPATAAKINLKAVIDIQ